MPRVSSPDARMNVNEMPYMLQLLWARHVLYCLVETQIKTRYQRSVLGFFWSLLNPIFTMLIYYFLLSIVFRVQMESYTIFMFSGVLPFTFFSTAVSTSTTSLVTGEGYYKSYYIPKMVFPLASVAVSLFDFAAAFAVLIGLGVFFGFRPSAALVILPLSLLFMVIFTMGCSLLASLMGAYFVDFRHMIAVAMQFLFFATPIVYPLDMVPGSLKMILGLNPLYYLVSNFNLPIYYHSFPSASLLTVSLLVSCGAVVLGAALFRKYEGGLVFCR